MSDRSAEEIRKNEDEPIQQEPLFASRPRWALEAGSRRKKVTGAVAKKHMTAAVNLVHASDYMTSRGDHDSPIRIGSAQRGTTALTKHLRRLLVQHAADLPGKHLKVLHSKQI
jgi:hypothetical protein